MNYFDLHCDTLCRCADENGKLEKNCFDVDIERLSKFDNCVQTFACFIHDDFKADKAEKRFLTLSEIYKNTDFGKITPILSIENLSCINRKLENIEKFAQIGVKMATLTWNGQNSLAGGINSDSGITDFGKEAVKLLEKCGIVVDASHLNEKSFYDLCKIATKPFVSSHSNSFSICNQKRNLKDEQFEIISDIGGVVGINLFNKFIGENENGFEDILRHIERFLLLGGEDCISLGTDFDGCSVHKSVKTVENMPRLYEYLQKNLGKTLADKIFYKNSAVFFKTL